jgi:hypothetical protein
MSQFSVPILFIIFNRPDNAQEVFNRIREIKPQYLYIHADGPRTNNESDALLCVKTREIVKQVDWDCEVKTLFREKNLGLREAITGAINWFFENVEYGIILEDDCLADKSFFYFCNELLEYYKNDTRVMHITGNNHQWGIKRGDGSYYFSRFPHCWGWATWRRAWKLNRKDFEGFELFEKNNLFVNFYENKAMQDYFINIMKKVKSGEIPSWAYAWYYSTLCENGLTIIPNVNLVSNIGFGEGATNCCETNSPLANMRCGEITEIVHPSFMIPDKEADYYTFRKVYKRPFLVRVKNKIKRLCECKL